MIRSLIVIVPRIAFAFPLFTATSSARSSDPTGLAAPPAANDVDRLFVQQAAMGGKADAELGRIAESRCAHERVKAFGRCMATEHGEADARLAAAAREARLPAPDHLERAQRLLADVGTAQGGGAGTY